jgi:hypothetical protein
MCQMLPLEPGIWSVLPALPLSVFQRASRSAWESVSLALPKGGLTDRFAPVRHIVQLYPDPPGNADFVSRGRFLKGPASALGLPG